MILVGTATQNGTAPCCGAEMDGEDTLVEEMGGEHSSAKQMDGENSSVGDRIGGSTYQSSVKHLNSRWSQIWPNITKN